MSNRPLILVVDDSVSDALLLSKSLAKSGLETIMAHDGPTAIQIATDKSPDLILLDMSMPGMDGLATCAGLRSNTATVNIPIIFVTSHTDTHHIVRAFASGGADYVTKPVRVDEILARISVQLRLREAEQNLIERNMQLESLGAQLAETNAELARLSRVDGLTSLLNRRAWDESSNLEKERSDRHNHAFCVFMLDVDFFKVFNDSQGHQAGDDCLRSVAQRIALACRRTDIVGRYGGEEFVVLAPEISIDGAATLAERIRQSVWDLAMPHPSSPAGRVTISIGVAASGNDALNEVIQRADGALYKAKLSGRNLVCTAAGTVPSMRPCKQTDHPIGETEANTRFVPTVLIVDDSDDNRIVYRGCLPTSDYRIIESVNGQEALAAVAKDLPDVIIMDVRMPKMDGIECTKRLKQDPATRNIPVIIVSACGAPGEIVTGLDAGADEYLTKPIRATELAVRVRSMARLSRERQDLQRSYQIREEQIRILTALVELCRGIGNAGTSDEILMHTIEAVGQVALSRRVSVMFPDACRRSLTIAKCIGLDPDVAARTRVTVDSGVAGRVFASQKAIIVNTESEAQKYERGEESDYFASVPLLSAPLGAGSEILGVLNVTERIGNRPFEERELEYIVLMSNIVGQALIGIRHRQARDEARDMIVIALAKLAEHRDSDTARHVDRVTQYSHILATALRTHEHFHDQIDEEFLQDLRRAVPLHDIGKVAIPDSILRKPGKLNVEEMAIMRRHADIGADTLRPVLLKVPDAAFLRLAEDVIRFHHEWYDGSGYPRGLAGDAIPLVARIVALADVYDALTTKRPYKKAISHDEAEKIIVRSAGTQFDPMIVGAFATSKETFRRLAMELADPHQEVTPERSQLYAPQLAGASA